MKNFNKILLLIIIMLSHKVALTLDLSGETESRYFCCNPTNSSICDGRSYAFNDRHSCHIGCKGTAKCVIKRVPVGINPIFAHDYSVLPLLHTHHFSNLNLPFPILHNNLSPHHYHYPDYANFGQFGNPNTPIRTNIGFTTNTNSSFEPNPEDSISNP